MAHSSLASNVYSVKNFTAGRQKPIRTITVHHMAGVASAQACANTLNSRGVSAHYGVGKGGEIASYVEEENTAWSNGNWPSNCETISIETSNSATGGDWPVSDAAYNSMVKLVADIAKRNNLGKLEVGKNLVMHKQYKNTNCPGPFLEARFQDIADKANEINNGGGQGQGVNKPGDGAGEHQKMTNEQVAHEIMYGNNVWGDGDDRKKNLEAQGYDYNAIQGIINATLLPNQEKRQEATPSQDLTGKTVVPVKLVDVNGTHLVQYDDTYTVTQDAGDEVVLSARGAVWARMKKENVRLA